MAANSASPLSQGRYRTFLNWRVQSSQTNSTSPGRAKPINPLLSMPRPQATKPQRASPACGLSPAMKAKPKHQMATPIQVATSMSWLMYWPPISTVRLVPSMMAARRAICSLATVRADRYSAASIKPACSAGTSRSAQALTPNVARDMACSQ